jgi:hypothetical protein
MPKKILKTNKPQRRVKRFDNCCTKCGHSLGWSWLAEYFNGVRFDPTCDKTVRVACSECDAISLVTMLVDFSTEDTGMIRKRK